MMKCEKQNGRLISADLDIELGELHPSHFSLVGLLFTHIMALT